MSRGSKIVYANKEFHKIFGYDLTENLLKRSLSDFFANHSNELQQKLQRDQFVDLHYEDLGYKNNKTAFPIEVSVTIIALEDGRANCFFIKDISGKKKIEQELKESEKKYLTLFNYSAIAMVESDYSQVKDYLDEIGFDKRDQSIDLVSYMRNNPFQIKKLFSLIKQV
ncbi:MAG: PAS domain-containing protein, partial [Candidatus Kariarchaeaceae archaeon]